MERFKKHLLVAIGFALAGMIGAAFGTGTAQAIVATLVQIVNTTTNPAFTRDADPATRLPYQSTVQFIPPGVGEQQTGIQMATVPVGYRLVTTNISAFLFLASGSP